MIGLSWFGVLVTASLPPSRTSHAQPEPNWPTPAASNCFLNSSNEPKAESIAAARSPLGRAAAAGAMFSQNIVWL